MSSRCEVFTAPSAKCADAGCFRPIVHTQHENSHEMRRSSGPALLFYSYCLGVTPLMEFEIRSGEVCESWSNWFSGITETDHHRRSVTKNGAASTYYSATSNANSGSNEDISSDPGFGFDHDRRGEDVKRRSREVVRAGAEIRSL
jgi:hypothetical protein